MLSRDMQSSDACLLRPKKMGVDAADGLPASGSVREGRRHVLSLRSCGVHPLLQLAVSLLRPADDGSLSSLSGLSIAARMHAALACDSIAMGPFNVSAPVLDPWWPRPSRCRAGVLGSESCSWKGGSMPATSPACTLSVGPLMRALRGKGRSMRLICRHWHQQICQICQRTAEACRRSHVG
jgi:hypothetical protein